MATAERSPTPGTPAQDAELRATVEALAGIERRSNSPGERDAAEWIAKRLERAGCVARIEEERSYDSYARPLAGLSVLGAAAGLLTLTRRARAAASLAAAAVAAAMA